MKYLDYNQRFYNIKVHVLIGDVMVSVLDSIAVDRGFATRWAQSKTINLESVTSPLSSQH